MKASHRNLLMICYICAMNMALFVAEIDASGQAVGLVLCVGGKRMVDFVNGRGRTQVHSKLFRDSQDQDAFVDGRARSRSKPGGDKQFDRPLTSPTMSLHDVYDLTPLLVQH
jgi:hypothetical protein